MTGGTNFRWVTALAAAAVAGTVTAVVMPRVAESAAVQWLVVLGVALVAALAVVLTTRDRVNDGVHVRDDALPPE